MTEMNVSEDRVVSFHYILKDEEGSVLDASERTEPLSYLHGHGQIIPGLEKALEGRVAGDEIEVTLPPDEGYGEHDPEQVVEVERARFDFNVKIGDFVQAQHPDGRTKAFQITEIGDATVKLDGNHPLAGKPLHFAVEVVTVREATAEELEHGHTHEGGHAH